MRMHDMSFLFKSIISFYSHYKNQPESIMWYYHKVVFFLKITNKCIPHERGAQLRKIGPIGLRPAAIK